MVSFNYFEKGNRGFKLTGKQLQAPPNPNFYIFLFHGSPVFLLIIVLPFHRILQFPSFHINLILLWTKSIAAG